jgi:hypothetical protein
VAYSEFCPEICPERSRRARKILIKLYVSQPSFKLNTSQIQVQSVTATQISPQGSRIIRCPGVLVTNILFYVNYVDSSVNMGFVSAAVGDSPTLKYNLKKITNLNESMFCPV